MPAKKAKPRHPGEILLTEFLNPLGISQYRLSKDIKVSARRVNDVVLGKRSITVDTALRLARYLGTTEKYWLDLQVEYDLENAREKVGKRIEQEVRVSPKIKK